MTQLYTNEQLNILKERLKKERLLLWAGAAFLLVFLVVMCIFTGVLNAEVMENVSTAVIMAGGLVLIYFYRNVYSENRAEIQHGTMLVTEPKELCEGTFELGEKPVRIRGSVTIRNITLDSETGKKRLNIIERKAGELGELSGKVRFETVHGYVAAFGRSDEVH